MNDQDEPFLTRWSRRKLEAKDAPPEAEVAPGEADARPAQAPDDAGANPFPRDGEKRALTDADFADVDFDALDTKSDYARFLAPGVPDSIKYRALRQLWASDPVLSSMDPFQDYIADYTDAAVAVPPGTLQTAYRVGKGFMTDEEVAVWEKLGRPQSEAAAAEAKPRTAAAIVAVEAADQDEVHVLLRQSDAYLSGLYPAASNHLLDAEALAGANVRFVVARCEGAAIGCGALIVGSDGEAEIKRMFVMPDARRGKVGRRILEALEAAAIAAGVRVVRLETGRRQPEALGLYRSHGYTERGPFGSYAKDPISVFFEKWIA